MYVPALVGYKAVLNNDGPTPIFEFDMLRYGGGPIQYDDGSIPHDTLMDRYERSI